MANLAFVGISLWHARTRYCEGTPGLASDGFVHRSSADHAHSLSVYFQNAPSLGNLRGGRRECHVDRHNLFWMDGRLRCEAELDSRPGLLPQSLVVLEVE